MRKTQGRTASGAPITDELVSELAKKAEAGYDVEQTLRRRGGRPLIGIGGSERRVGATRAGVASGVG